MTDPQFSLTQNLAQTDENRITYFGVTDTRNKRIPFGIKREDRSRHTYVIGKTGMGKSTLLENMAVQDIQSGEGLCFIDPHGGTAEKLMEYIPEDRIKDVLYFAPFDMQYPVSFNVLESVDADKRHLVVAGLMSTFEKIWVDAWSARMAYILQNTLASLLEFPGATLLGVNRMYIDKEYRKNVIAKITDPAVRSFWVDEYSKYTDRYAQEATPAIQNKIGQFASNALVRNVIGQEQSAFNIRELMDQRKIFIVNLSKGRVGEGNANLLGSMLITKIYLAAMSRADVSAGNMRAMAPFYLYVDEFQNFANKSFADILSEARKYKLALTIAHQYIEQMEEEVASAVFGNVGTMITFRVGAYDAEVLEKEFSPTFTAEDLVNLGSRQIYLKLMIDGVSSHPFSAATMPPIQEPEVSHRDRAVAFSRAQFSRPREEVEKDIANWVAQRYEDPEAPAKEAARQERRAQRDEFEGGRPAYAPVSANQRPPLSRPPRQEGPGSAPRPPMSGPPRTFDRGSRPPSAPQAPRSDYSQQPQRSVDRPPAAPYTRRPDAPAEVRTYVAPQSDAPARPSQSAPRTPHTPPQREGGEVTRRPFAPPRPLPPEKKQESIADLRSVLARMAPPQPQQADASPVESVERTQGAQAATPPPAARSTPAPGTPRPAPPRDDGKSVTADDKQQLRDLLATFARATHPAEGAPQTVQSSPPQPPRVPAQSPTRPASPHPTRSASQPPHARVVTTQPPVVNPVPTTVRPQPTPRMTPPKVVQQNPPTTEHPRPTNAEQSPQPRPAQHIRVQREQVATREDVPARNPVPTPPREDRPAPAVSAPPPEIPPVDLRAMLHVDKPDVT